MSKLAAVFLLFAVVVPVWGQAGQRVFQVPFGMPGDVRASNVFIAAPFVRIAEPWDTFSRKKAGGEEEAALQELFSAIYLGDPAAAAARVNPPKEAASGKPFADYIAAFKASLQRMGDFEVEGYFPLPGEVRFALRPLAAKTPYRLITLRPGPQGRLRFDETVAPGQVDAVLNTVFRVLKEMNLEVSNLPQDGYTLATAQADPPYGDVRLAVKAHLIDADLNQVGSVPADAALQFYKTCLSVSSSKSMEQYFRCFQADVQSRLREEFTKMGADKQNNIVAMTSSPRHVDFVVENPSAEVVFYHNTSYSVASRDWVERTSTGTFFLLNPLSSFPLDDLLSSSQIRASIASALGSRNRATGAQLK